MRRGCAWVGVVFWAFAFAACRTAPSEVNEGNRYYAKGSYERALSSYQRAFSRVRPNSRNAVRLRYNLATTYYQLNQTGTATAELLQTTERLSDDRREVPLRVRAYYNLGNAFYREGDFGRAVDAYIEALRLDPSDRDAKHNLELALDRLRQQAASGGAPQSEEPNPTPEPGEGTEQPLPQRPAGLSPEEARRLLDMLGNDDAQSQQERLRKLLPPRYDVEKDW